MKSNIEFAGELISNAAEQTIRKTVAHEREHKFSETPELTGSFQLPMAAQILVKTRLKFDDEFSPPFNWDDAHWRGLCLEPYKERLLIAAAFLVAEADRVETMEENEEEWDPTKIKES